MFINPNIQNNPNATTTTTDCSATDAADIFPVVDITIVPPKSPATNFVITAKFTAPPDPDNIDDNADDAFRPDSDLSNPHSHVTDDDDPPPADGTARQ